MTKEELRAHCEKQVKMCEEWAKGNDREPSGKIYEEHKLILDLIKSSEQQPSEDKVSVEVYKQVMSERDIAIEQLRELGYSFGEKIRTSDDCVSRAEINKLYDEYRPRLATHVSEFEDKLKALPPVIHTQSWLPVSEKLPEESGNYLLYGKVVDYEENCVFIGEYDSDYEKFGYEENIYDSETLGFLDSEFCEYNKVIAWQPLPEPYAEKRGSEE